jgi:hypothetical protein
MTLRPKNATLVDWLRSLHPKVPAKSMFTVTVPLCSDSFAYVHQYRRMHDSDEVIDVDKSDDESGDGDDDGNFDTPDNIKTRQGIYNKAMYVFLYFFFGHVFVLRSYRFP